MTSDVELVGDLCNGSPPAFEKLVQKHQFAVRWQISHFVDHPQTADDLAQEVFLDLFRARHSPPNPDAIRSWLLTTARNKAVDYVRRRSRQPTSIAIDSIDVSDHRTAIASEDQNAAFSAVEQQLAALEHCLGLLKPEHRELIDEFYLQAKSSELIAARIGKGSGAVRMLLLRIRKALGKCIRKQIERSNP